MKSADKMLTLPEQEPELFKNTEVMSHRKTANTFKKILKLC